MSAVTRLLKSFLGNPTTTRPARTQLGFAFLEDRVVLSGSPATVAAVGSVSSVLNQEVVAFDVTTKGRVSFNTSAGTYAAKIELPGGASLDTPALKTLMSGAFALPKVNPVQAAASFAGLKTAATDDYDAVRTALHQQHGGGNVYLSSKQFTDWASAENVASTIGAAVLTGGSTAGQIVREAADVFTNELSNLYTWLRNKAPAVAEATVAEAFKAILTGQELNSPHLEVKFVNVRHTYTVGLGGAAAVLADGLGANTSRSVVSTHKGFAVIWKGPGAGADSLTASLNAFIDGRTPGQGALTTLLTSLANRPEFQGLGPVVSAVLAFDPAGAANRLVVDNLSTALGVTRAELLAVYTPGSPVLDLTALPFDERLAALLGNLAAGNEGSAKVTKLEFNLNTYEVTAEVEVRHRHTWGSVADILAAVGRQVGEWADKAGNAVRQQLDAAGNTVRTLAYRGADTVRETFDRVGALIAKSVTNSAGYRTLEAAWQNGVKTWETTRDSVGRMLQQYSYDGVKAFTTWYADGVRTGERVVQNGVTLVNRAWENGVKTLDVVKDTAGRLVSEYWRSGADEFRNLYTNGARTAFSKWTSGVNTAHNTYDAAGKYLTKYWVDGGRQISQWFTNGQVSAESVVQNGVRIAEKAWENGVNTLNRVRDAANRLVSEYWRSGADEFRNLYTNGARTAFSKWTSGVNTAHNTYTQAGARISEYWRVGADEFQNTYTNGVRTVYAKWTSGVQVARNTYDQAGTILTAYWRDGAREFKNVYQNGVRVAQNVWENGVNVAQHVWNSAGGYIGNALNNVGSAASNAWNTVRSWF